MSTMTAAWPTTFVPSEWLISKEFRRSDGVTCSLGEPVPELSAAEAEGLTRDGFIIRAGAVPQEPARVLTPEFLLSGNDLQVLRKLREHKAGRRMLRGVYSLAVATQRSFILLESLRLVLGIPVDAETAAAAATAMAMGAPEVVAPAVVPVAPAPVVAVVAPTVPVE